MRALKTSNGIRENRSACSLRKLVLVIVMVRRAENHAAHAALRDKRVCALGRFDGRALGLVKRGEMIFQNVRHRLVLAQPRRVVERANKQRLGNRAIGLFLHAQPDGITFRLLQNDLRDLEKRKRPAGHLDLARERFDALFVRQKGDGDFRQRRGRLAQLAFAPVIAAGKFPFAVAESWTRTRRTRAAAFAKRFAARPAPAAFALAVIARDGFARRTSRSDWPRLSLRPRGLEKLLQINFDVRNTAHA